MVEFKSYTRPLKEHRYIKYAMKITEKTRFDFCSLIHYDKI